MKKLIITILCFCSITSFAQDGFFLQPIIGAGFTNMKHNDDNDHMTSGDYAFTFDGGVRAGYQAGKWRFNTGLGYLRTGTKIPITLTDALGNPIGTSYIRYRYSHLVLPITVGRTFSMTRKLSLTPSAGPEFSYNISSTEKDDFDGRVVHMSSSQFNGYYQRLSCFGLLEAALDYRVSPGLSLSLTPSFDYMLTNFAKTEDGAPFTTKEHPYVLLLNAGVKWAFAGKEKQPMEKMPMVRSSITATGYTLLPVTNTTPSKGQ